jgi:hypothetical protein
MTNTIQRVVTAPANDFTAHVRYLPVYTGTNPKHQARKFAPVQRFGFAHELADMAFHGSPDFHIVAIITPGIRGMLKNLKS